MMLFVVEKYVIHKSLLTDGLQITMNGEEVIGYVSRIISNILRCYQQKLNECLFVWRLIFDYIYKKQQGAFRAALYYTSGDRVRGW